MGSLEGICSVCRALVKLTPNSLVSMHDQKTLLEVAGFKVSVACAGAGKPPKRIS